MKSPARFAATQAARCLFLLACAVTLSAAAQADTQLLCSERPSPGLAARHAPDVGLPSRVIAPAHPEGVAVESAQWSQLGVVGSPGGAPVYDPVRDRLIVFGGMPLGGSAGNGVWALSLSSGALDWQEIGASGGPPPARAFHSAIYDPLRDRLIVYGGTTGSYYQDEPLSDVWALSLSGNPTWTQLLPSGSGPPGRAVHNAVYDSARDRMVIFGGTRPSGYLNDVWALSLAGTPAWINLKPTRTPPDARYGAAAIYDPVRDRLLLFGGEVAAGQVKGDLWQLSFMGTPAWSEVTPAAGAAPCTRIYAVASYDPVGDRMLLFGGGSGYPLNDLWELPLGVSPQWNQLTPAGSPPARWWPGMVMDSARSRLLLFGGGEAGTRADLWSLPLQSGPGWSELMGSESVPSQRYGHSAFYDIARDRLMNFGGVYTYYFHYDYPQVPYNEVNVLDFSGSPTWSTLAPQGTAPTPVYNHSTMYDPLRDRLLVFGGHSYYQTPTPGVMQLSLSGTPTWSPLATSGTAPIGRRGHTAIYDRARDRMILYGGEEWVLVNGIYVDSLFDDVWALSLTGPPTWTKLQPLGTPPSARVYHSAIYDPDGDRMVVFGGRANYSNNEVWALSLGANPTWTNITPAVSGPFNRYYHSAAYDSRRRRMVIFGGKLYPTFTDDLYSDTWSLSLIGPPEWTAIAGGSFTPAARYGSQAVYDSLRDRMVMFWGTSGYCATGAFADVWTLQFSAFPLSVGLASATAAPDRVTLTWFSNDGSSVFATVQRRDPDGEWAALGVASSDGSGRISYEDLSVVPSRRYAYRLRYSEGGREVLSGEVWVTVPDRFALSLRGALPNPSRSGFEVAFALPDAAPARLELLDVAGRRIASREVGSLGPGAHTLRLRETAGLAPGVYVVRLARSDRAITARACVVR